MQLCSARCAGLRHSAGRAQTEQVVAGTRFSLRVADGWSMHVSAASAIVCCTSSRLASSCKHVPVAGLAAQTHAPLAPCPPGWLLAAPEHPPSSALRHRFLYRLQPCKTLCCAGCRKAHAWSTNSSESLALEKLSRWATQYELPYKLPGD